MAQPYSRERPWRRSRLTIAIPQPAAGADWLLTVPAGHLYRVRAVFGQLVTSAVVGSRVGRLVLGDGAATFADIPAPASQATTLTRLYTWGVGMVAGAVGARLATACPDVTLMPGWTIGSGTETMDVGDQWSAIRVLVEDTTALDGRVDFDALPEMIVEVGTLSGS